jgi:hypothetical protein
MTQAFSIRQSLQGALQDFVRQSGFSCVLTEETVRELVCLLASYREENVLLFPEVFVVDKLDALNSLAPGLQRLAVRSDTLGAALAAKMLKDCASLASGGWAVYVAKTGETSAEYGMIRAQRHSFARSAEESMLNLGNAAPVLLVRNRGHLVVELRNSNGARYTVALTSTPAAPSPLSTNVERFVQAAAGVAEEDRVRFVPYLVRLLTELLQRCHGTLLAVFDFSESGLPPPSLADGVWLKPAISLAAMHAAAVRESSADALADLQSVELLLSGMINSDGVVVFDAKGGILAYRVFLKPEDSERRNLPEVGGGRRRAYELMQLRIGTVFKAVLIRSQDGETDCKGINS